MLRPSHDGIDAILALRRIDPKLRIIAMSGGGARIPSGLALATADAFGADAVLQKPFTRRLLMPEWISPEPPFENSPVSVPPGIRGAPRMPGGGDLPMLPRSAGGDRRGSSWER